jgi:hypothetical protein
MNNGHYNNPEYIRKQSVAKRGNKNPKWKGGNSRTHINGLYTPLIKSLKQQCCMCGSKTKLVIHHIDGDYKHNELSNMAVVCRGCHNTIHKTKGEQK